MKKFEQTEKTIEQKKHNIERTKIVNLRILLIEELVNDTCNKFFQNLDAICKGNYTEELLSKENNSIIDVLRQFNRKMVYDQREIHTLELTGETVIKGLLTHFVDTFIKFDKLDENKWSKKYIQAYEFKADKLFNLISRSFKEIVKIEIGKDNLKDMNDYTRLQLVVDFISGMTDNFALNLFQKLQGIKI